MSSAPTEQPSGAFYKIPFIGWIARDMVRDFFGNFPYLLVIIVTLLVVAVKIWGLVALGLAALATVPVIFVMLILITLG